MLAFFSAITTLPFDEPEAQAANGSVVFLLKIGSKA
jgi:hypothetical protein